MPRLISLMVTARHCWRRKTRNQLSGCSINQLCPCNGPWKNHGAYVSCVAHRSDDFVAAGLIPKAERDAIVSNAAPSSCGKEKSLQTS